jgi:pyruvate dehydrogenase (quinone)
MLDKQADPARSKDVIHPQAVARAVSDLAKRDAVFVFDTGLNTLWSANWIRQSGSQRIIGSFNNAAVGTALGQANGIQALDRSRQVVALCGDGGFNMLMCEFLTAVHHKLPVKAVVYNNSAFGLITLEAESVGLPPFKEGIEFPNPDFAALARACGGHGFKATKPGELNGAISEAFAVDGPAIVDAVVAANELPNLPHIELKTWDTLPWQRSRKHCSQSPGRDGAPTTTLWNYAAREYRLRRLGNGVDERSIFADGPHCAERL